MASTLSNGRWSAFYPCRNRGSTKARTEVSYICDSRAHALPFLVSSLQLHLCGCSGYIVAPVCRDYKGWSRKFWRNQKPIEVVRRRNVPSFAPFPFSNSISNARIMEMRENVPCCRVSPLLASIFPLCSYRECIPCIASPRSIAFPFISFGLTTSLYKNHFRLGKISMIARGRNYDALRQTSSSRVVGYLFSRRFIGSRFSRTSIPVKAQVARDGCGTIVSSSRRTESTFLIRDP